MKSPTNAEPADEGPPLGLARHVAIQLQATWDRKTVDAVVLELGLPHPLTEPIDTRISVVQEAAFIQAATEAAGDLDFAILAGLKLQVSTALPGYISEHSGTLRDALTDACHFLPLVRPGMDFRLEEHGNVATLQLALSDPALHPYSRYVECMYAGVIGQIRSFTARPFHPELVAFRHDRLPVGIEARSGLGCPVEFGTENTEMLMGKPALDRPIRGRDDVLRAVLVHHGELLESHAERHGLSFAERVELHIQQSIPDEIPDADKMSHALGVSRRTLSRRLMEAETSFADILSDVRMKLAGRELRDTDRQIGEIAWRLGYTSQSAFATAFKRATGHSPSEFRASGTEFGRDTH